MKYILTFLLAGLSLQLWSQNEIDALRYSRLQYLGGTARFSAMGGAFGALGGDFSAIGINPAGMAIYRKGEVMFTPAFFLRSTDADYLKSFHSDSKSNFNISNGGLVLAHAEDGEEREWKGVALAFGYNRLNNFHNRIAITGKNESSSLLDVYSSSSFGKDINTLDPFGSLLAWNTWVMDTVSNGNYYHVLQNYGQLQEKFVETRGTMGETFFGFGGNYANKLFLGFSMGFPHIRYREESSHTESVENDSIYGFKSFTLRNDLLTNGAGFHAKFGMIFKPVDWIRIGGSFQTPTYFELTDQYSSTMESHFTSNSYNSESPQGAFDYTLTTPVRVTGSLAFVYKKIGMISADYEFVDYSDARLRSKLYNYHRENSAIREKYQSAGILRVGAEVNLSPIALRAGYILSENPFKAKTGNESISTSYSFGIGFKDANTFVDLAYIWTAQQENYYLYDPAIVKPAALDMRSSAISLTMGWKF